MVEHWQYIKEHELLTNRCDNEQTWILMERFHNRCIFSKQRVIDPVEIEENEDHALILSTKKNIIINDVSASDGWLGYLNLCTNLIEKECQAGKMH